MQPDYVFVCYYTGNDAISENPAPRRGLRRPRFHENLLDLYPRNLVTLLRNRLIRRPDPPEHAMPGTTVANPLTRYLSSEDAQVRERVGAIAPDMMKRALAWRVNPWIVAGSIDEPDLLRRQIRRNNENIRNPSGFQVLTEIRDAVNDIGAETVLVLIPPGYTVNLDMWPALSGMGYVTREGLLHDRRFQDAYIHFASQLGIQCVDLLPTLEQAGNGTYFALDPHNTAYGNEVIAQVLAGFLLNELISDN